MPLETEPPRRPYRAAARPSCHAGANGLASITFPKTFALLASARSSRAAKSLVSLAIRQLRVQIPQTEMFAYQVSRRESILSRGQRTAKSVSLEFLSP